MDKTLLKIENLSVQYEVNKGIIKAVDNLNLSLKEGERLGIIGESGSGKTSLAMAIIGLIKPPGKVKGNIFFKGENINKLSKDKLNKLRWKKIAIVFQNNLDVLNPLLTIYEQIYEVIVRHTVLNKRDIDKRIIELLTEVGLDSAIGEYYPHQLSGGMRQRVLIAMSLACEPELLIVDEPTSSLDMISKAGIIKLLLKLYREKRFSLLVISHELDTVLKLTSKISIMYSGTIVEKGKTFEVITNPMHVYTRGLLNSSPAINPYGDMWGIPGEINKYNGQGCPFNNRCNQGIEVCKNKKPTLKNISLKRQVACNRGGIATVLVGEGIFKTYKYKGKTIEACKNCKIKIKGGETVVLIGESGSGKTTLANILSGIIEADKGDVFFDGVAVKGNNFTRKKHGIQIVFQDPFSSINEKLSIADVIGEPLEIINRCSGDKFLEEIKKVLQDVQLPNDKGFIFRKCYTLSGGQRQRVALARSLIMEPKLLIADEISSMLDPSTQANILRLLKKLQNQKGFSMLYITHDLPIARKIGDRVYVMSRGIILEEGVVRKVFSNPENDYTKTLINTGLNFI